MAIQRIVHDSQFVDGSKPPREPTLDAIAEGPAGARESVPGELSLVATPSTLSGKPSGRADSRV